MITVMAALALGWHVAPRERFKAECTIFLLKDCPIANQYMPEIERIKSKYSSKGIQFILAIEDSDATPSTMDQFKKSFNYDGAIVLDDRHVLAKQMHATVSPTAVVQVRSRAVYRGRIDDTYASISKRRTVTQSHDLRRALDEVLAGKAVDHAQTQAVGCRLY